MYIYDDIKLIVQNARAVPLFTPKEERALARAIAETRIDLWENTLSYHAFCPYMIDLARPELESILNRASVKRTVDLSSLDELRQYAEMARQQKKLKLFTSRKNDVARVISDIDRGLEVFDKVNREIRKDNPFGRPKPPKNSRKFPDYLDALDAKLKAHRKLKERFWRANIRLAVSLTKKYDHGMIPFADMMQEALIGLMTAVERFDYKKGFRFSTYATWWVRHALNRFLANHGRTVRWPAHVVTDFEHLKTTRNKIINRGERPTVELLAEESGIKLKRVERIVGLRTIQPISFDAALVGFDRSETLADRIADEKLAIDETSPNIDPALDRIKSEIYGLPGIEGDVLIKRFGLDGKAPLTLREIAEQHSLSRERIRQLENRGLDRLREIVRR